MDTEKKVSIKDIAEFFNFERVCGNDESLNRWVIVPDINRPGLELTGFYLFSEPKRIIILGDKEEAYINNLSLEAQRERFDHLTDGYTPCIVLSKNRKCPEVLYQVANEKNFPIFRSKQPSYRCMVDIVSYLDEYLSPTDSLHGVLLNVYGTGVLIIGESGMGKSEITLELIQKGHILVADDRVDVKRVHNKIVGRAPDILKGMLEIRGIGIIDVGKMFGVSAVLSKEEINMVIHLVKFENSIEFDRVGIEEQKYKRILGFDIPMTILPVKEGRSMGVLVESAVKNYRLKQQGFDSGKEFEKRVRSYIEESKEQE